MLHKRCVEFVTFMCPGRRWHGLLHFHGQTLIVCPKNKLWPNIANWGIYDPYLCLYLIDIYLRKRNFKNSMSISFLGLDNGPDTDVSIFSLVYNKFVIILQLLAIFFCYQKLVIYLLTWHQQKKNWNFIYYSSYTIVSINVYV